MNAPTGEVIVAGLVTGTHIIEDIGVGVPHKIAVRIPADQALRSKDLWRGIQQGKLFKLDGGWGLQAAARGASVESGRIVELEAEVAKLTRELEVERARNAGLQDILSGLSGLSGQLKDVQTSLGELGTRPIVVQGSGSVAQNGAVGVVGGEVPTFVPERIRPESAETQIQPTIQTTEKTNVSSAASKLRELKRQNNG